MPYVSPELCWSAFQWHVFECDWEHCLCISWSTGNKADSCKVVWEQVTWGNLKYKGHGLQNQSWFKQYTTDKLFWGEVNMRWYCSSWLTSCTSPLLSYLKINLQSFSRTTSANCRLFSSVPHEAGVTTEYKQQQQQQLLRVGLIVLSSYSLPLTFYCYS